MKNPFYVLSYFFMIASFAQGQSVPVINSFSPATGSAGTTVIISGANFSTTPANNIVYFGATKVIVNSATETTLNVSVPVGTTNQPITVTVNGLTAYSDSPFVTTFSFTGSIGASFANRLDLWAGFQTKWETVSDIDGDGKNDIVVADQGNNTVSVFRNVSTPGSISWNSFEPKVDFSTGPGPYSVVAGDLDGDGKMDLVVTNSGGTSISVFLNTSVPGSISFSPSVDFEAVAGADFAAIQDLDMDGKPDIAVASTANFAEGFVSVFRNTSSVGAISFASKVDLTAGHGGVWGLALHDIDGNGKPDIIVTSGGDALVSIYRNISTPGSISLSSFDTKTDFATGSYPAIISIADIDGDHKPDLAVGNAGGNTISLFRNTATSGIINSSSFAPKVDLASPGGPWNTTSGDVDGDGKPDIIVRDGTNGTLSIFRNKSTAGIISADSFSPPYTIETGGTSLGISVADMDGDGKSDITISNEGSNMISVFRNENIFQPSGPSHLVFSSVGNTTLNANFLASPDLPDGYITIRRIGSPPNPPVNGTAYSIGQTIGDDVVAYIGTATAFDDSGLTPGVEYYYNCYAYNGDGATVEYITAHAASNIAFTIGFDLGPIISVSPSSFTLDDEITITFDATKSFPLNALVGASSIYMYSGAITEGPESGNWNLNYANYGYMSSLGDNKWSITFIPRYFHNNVPLDQTVYRLAMVFYDFDSHRGVSFDGRDIYLPVSPTILTPPEALPATFVSNTGFEAEWNSVYGISEYHLDVSASAKFDSFLDGYENKVIYGWATIRTTVTGLLPNTNYFYRVRAAGISENSLTMLVTTNPNPQVLSPNVWVKEYGSFGNDEIQTMTSDDKGNVYAAGHFSGTITIGKKTLTSNGDYDIFFVRYDPKGNVEWVRSIGGSALDNEVSLATDSKGLYMSAQSSGDIDVDPGAGITLFRNEGEYYQNDGFFARYNLSDGSLVWARKLVDASTWSSASIGVDQSGVYLTGHYNGTIDFDPGQGVALHTSQYDDIFLAKYSLKGSYIWSGSMGGYFSDTAWGLLVDATGVYISGKYSWGSDLDPTINYYPLDGEGGFFGRYSLANGNLIYAKNVGNNIIYSLDKHGNDLYISGEFYGSIDADPGNSMHIIGRDGFNSGLIGKYNLLDGSYRWANSLITTSFIGPRKIIADGSGAYVSGYFAGSVDFGTGQTMANRTSVQIDAFSSHYAANGTLDWAKGIGSPGYAVSIAATLTDDGYYMGGVYGKTVNFDPYLGNVTRTSTGGSGDIFIARYRLTKKIKKDNQDNDDMLNVSANDNRMSIRLFPNPVENILSIDWQGFDSNEPIEIRILDLFGKPVMSHTMTMEESSIDITALSRGYHIFQARQNDTMQMQRFIKK